MKLLNQTLGDFLFQSEPPTASLSTLLTFWSFKFDFETVSNSFEARIPTPLSALWNIKTLA